MAFVTLKDIARETGVSTAAVSQVLRNKGRVSDKTRQAVMEAAARMGYVPDQRARAMRSSGNKTVGLLVPDLKNPYFADLVTSMEDELYGHGVSTLIGTSAEDLKRQDAFIENLLGQRIDGAIVVPQGVASPGVRSLIASDLPLVFVDRRVEGIESVPCVVSDPYTGIREALRSLVALGHRRIGYVAHSSLGSFSVNERKVAFQSLASEICAGEGGMVVDCDATYESHRHAVDTLLAREATAVICAYSPDAITIAGLLQDRHVAIGRELSLVSFDDIAAFRLMIPNMAVISQQAELMAGRGVELLLETLRSGEHHGGTTFRVPTMYLPRESAGPLAPDPLDSDQSSPRG